MYTYDQIIETLKSRYGDLNKLSDTQLSSAIYEFTKDWSVTNAARLYYRATNPPPEGTITYGYGETHYAPVQEQLQYDGVWKMPTGVAYTPPTYTQAQLDSFLSQVNMAGAPKTTTTKPTTTTTTPTVPYSTATGPTSNYTGLPEFTANTTGGGYTAPAIPMGGATEDQINYLSNLRRLATQDKMARVQSQQQRSEIATQYEPQIRKAGRDIYNQGVKAQASLGARGISGAPGISVAARRAAMAAPAAQRTSLITDRNRQLAALERTLATQLSSYEEEIRRNQEQLTRATTLANQLTGTGK
jgi:hypothetical protein